MSDIFEDKRIDVWPRFKFRKKQRESEESRATALQTYTRWAGGVALFAYVYTHREGIKSSVKEQVRSFQIGVINSDTSLHIISGEVLIRKKNKILGRSDTYEPRFDEETLSQEGVGEIEDVLRIQKNSEQSN